MNPYQVMGIIVTCTLIFAGVVSMLAMQGVPLLLAFLGVYLIAVACMIVMQRRARDLYDGAEHRSQRSYDREATRRRIHITELEQDEEKVLAHNQLHA